MTRGRGIFAVGLIAVVLTASGCGSSSKPNPGLNQAPSTTAASATMTPAALASSTATTPNGRIAKAQADALAAYNGMVKAMTEELNSNKLNPAVLKYADGAAYDLITNALTISQNQKIIYVGQPRSSPKVSATNLSADPNTVTISDCFGGPSWAAVFTADDNQGHKKGQSANIPMPPAELTATVQNMYGHWKVTNYTFIEGSKC